METAFKSTGVYVHEGLSPELMRSLRKRGLSMSRRMKIAKIFKDDSLILTFIGRNSHS